ncbi:protein CROWDED NUCLEI 2 [Dorcoceras hygrometricum]|uniref:Protein CROWDED NUCLEI 2 n=1 Tax=Dorcoceras hygrometricum TaxID=472368 RepID=A0A2Z7AA93_9LAMI|nr:protein CROWDED NUCLEI 2 [Dorcoceras hygrometricum]
MKIMKANTVVAISDGASRTVENQDMSGQPRIRKSSELKCFVERGASLPFVSCFGANSVVANSLGILLYEHKLLGAEALGLSSSGRRYVA